jgi:hypothetical protein
LNTGRAVEAIISAAVGGIIAFYGASYLVRIACGYSVTAGYIAAKGRTIPVIDYPIVDALWSVLHSTARLIEFFKIIGYLVAAIVAVVTYAIVGRYERFQILSRLASQFSMRNEITDLSRKVQEVEELKRERNGNSRTVNDTK